MRCESERAIGVGPRVLNTNEIHEHVIVDTDKVLCILQAVAKPAVEATYIINDQEIYDQSFDCGGASYAETWINLVIASTGLIATYWPYWCLHVTEQVIDSEEL